MKVTPVLLFLFLFATALQCFSQTPVWSQFPASPGGTTRHDDICFVNQMHGWSARGRDGIYRTKDGGNTWLKVLTNAATHFRSIGFVSETVGFAGNLGPGSYDANVTDTNLLYRTSDGGDTWTVVPGLNETGMKGFCALQVLDAQHIFGGGRVRGPAHFVKSTDGGTNWTVVDLTSMGIMNGIMDIHFHDPSNGIVVGMDTNAFATSCSSPYYGRIAKTTDGGTTWTVVATTPVSCSYFWKMSWPSPNVGYASLQQNGSRNRVIVYKTLDGGHTWAPLEVLYSSIGVSSYFSQGIGFISENEGWMGGDTSSAPASNHFLHTTDGGTNWTPVGYADARAINKIRIYPNFAVASGYKLHVYRVPLAISSQPQSQTNVPGSTVSFSVTAHGTAPLQYQWRHNSTNVFSNTNTYSIPNVQGAHAGNYDVVVSDYSGSVTSSVAVLTLEGIPIAPAITTQPRSRTVRAGTIVSFDVVAVGTAPLQYQWRLGGTNLANEIGATLIRTNVQLGHGGAYSVVVSNAAGSVESDPAMLSVFSADAFLFHDDFENYSTPTLVSATGTTNGYKIMFGAVGGGLDFRAIFGFDYSAVRFPINIPPAPHSADGATRGLFLQVNKDTTPASAAVNLYPIGLSASNDFSLKFDMWLNWTNLSSASEHTLFGINHSGEVMNRILQNTSDGLFFAVNPDGNINPAAVTMRDYAVYRGGGAGLAPVLMLPSNTSFGPLALLGSRFDNTDAGFVGLFPSKTIPGYPTTPNGTAGLGWVSGEVRQESTLITWLLNGVQVAQYTNNSPFTNGNIMIGLNDAFDSVGSTNNFVIFDNLRVERIFPGSPTLLPPSLTGNLFNLPFLADAGATYSVQRRNSLTTGMWITYTNVLGSSGIKEITIPITPLAVSEYYRITRP